MWIGWGPELTFLYNDAYAHMTLGAKHPWALGRPAREVWAEIWPQIAAAHRQGAPHRRGDLGRRRCCCSSSATAIPRRPTTPSPTARCPTTTGDDRGQLLRRHRGDRAGDRRAAAGLAAHRWPRGLAARDDAAPTCSPRSKLSVAEEPRDLPFALIYRVRRGRHAAAPRGAGRHRGDAPGGAAGDRRCDSAGRDLAVRARCWRSAGDHRPSIWIRAAAPPFPARAVGQAARPRAGGADRAAGPGAAVGGVRRRAQSVSSARRHLSQLRQPVRRPDRRRPGQRAALRRGARARRGAGGDRSRQDGVLLQRQPRVPHAADADARADGGRARRQRRHGRARSSRRSTATSCGCSSW